jgi:outer membrane lipoprotein-sorting protein
MFMKTGRKNHRSDLFSPARKPRFGSMSILLSTVFPLALFAGLPAGALPAALAPAMPQPALAQPAKTKPPMPVEVKLTRPAAKPAAAPPPAAVAPQAPQLVQIQQPGPAAPPEPAAAARADRAAIVAKVEKALTEVKTAQGSFSQIDAQGEPASGMFYISRPGKIRFVYDKPEPMFIVSDGVTVSIEEPSRDAYDSAPLSSTPLSLFLRSNVDLKRDGSVTDVSTANGSHFVTLVDRTGEAEGKMILEFRASDFELLGWRSLDGAGAETRVKLSDVKKNVSLKPALFVVRDPADRDREHR